MTTNDNQSELFPETVSDVLSRIPLALNHAELLHKEGLISFQPVLSRTVLPSERSELYFVGTLAKSVPFETLTYLLNKLTPPYRYVFNDIYFDWVKGEWRAFPEEQDIYSIIEDTDDIDELESIRETVEEKIEMVQDSSHSEIIDYSKFILNQRDWDLINHVKMILQKIMRAPVISNDKLVSVSKGISALERLPKKTEDFELSIEVNAPKKFIDRREILRCWSIRMKEDEVYFNSGGYYYSKETGRNSFAVYNWIAQPGYETSYDDYRDNLWMIPSLVDFKSELEEIDFSNNIYTVLIKNERDHTAEKNEE